MRRARGAAWRTGGVAGLSASPRANRVLEAGEEALAHRRRRVALHEALPSGPAEALAQLRRLKHRLQGISERLRLAGPCEHARLAVLDELRGAAGVDRHDGH